MDINKEKEKVLQEMEQLYKSIESEIGKDALLFNRGERLNSFGTPLLKSIIYGLLGMMIAISLSIILSQVLSLNYILLLSPLLLLFSTLGVVLSLYNSKGGGSAVGYDVALQEIENEINRQKKEIESLIKMEAPAEQIAKRWLYLDELESRRIAIVSAKSKVYYKRLFKKDSKDFENEKSNIEKKNKLLIEPPKNESLELKQEKIKEELKVKE